MSDFESCFARDIPADASVLDVREDYEWSAGHIAEAKHLPLAELSLRFEELDPDADTYVICRTGGRSWQAAQWLSSLGYYVINVRDGLDGWLEASRPLVSETQESPYLK